MDAISPIQDSLNLLTWYKFDRLDLLTASPYFFFDLFSLVSILGKLSVDFLGGTEKWIFFFYKIKLEIKFNIKFWM